VRARTLIPQIRYDCCNVSIGQLLLEAIAMNLRPAQANDQATIESIIRSARINPMSLHWQHFTVAEEDGQTIGIGQIKKHGDGSRELASIAVIPAYQHRGVASAIISELLARESGPLYLFCRAPLAPFYERFGFRRIERAEMPPYFRRMHRLGNLFEKLARSTVQIAVMKR
jgi:amino-acid N-acetyltransferase